jgi:hypothetical protein
VSSYCGKEAIGENKHLFSTTAQHKRQASENRNFHAGTADAIFSMKLRFPQILSSRHPELIRLLLQHCVYRNVVA